MGKLYSTYYPRKLVDTQDLLRIAQSVAGWLPALKRWWEGTDNQGQYRAKAGQTILDIGCGSGLSLLEAIAMGATAYGIETDPNVRTIAEELDLNIHIGSLHDVPFPDVFFDLIVLNQVIEHIPEPGKALDALRKRLRPDGRIVLAFPNRGSFWQRLSGERWINWHIPYHLHHFDAVGFKAFAHRHGYRVLTQSTITPNLWTALQLRALFETPHRGIPAPQWQVKSASNMNNRVSQSSTTHTPSLSLRRVLRYTTRLVVLSGLAILNRAIDALRQGDSLLVELAVET
ncbi:MAG: class I SAM-dependent methyltransferase [Betaproteobacteria bacterium]|nr:class I SAM-dependent methyltransferase [Betaproteobacteria bacterium]